MTDYIKREDAIDALTADALERNLDSVMTDTASRYHRAAQRVVSVVPAADVAPVVCGTWIGIDDFPYEDFECSSCGAQMLGDDKIPQEMHYCPNCGAKMEVQDA